MPADLEVVFQPDNVTDAGKVLHKIDIVFVHGLNPKSDPQHSEHTWTHQSGMMWPRDLLPQKIPYARICIFTYNSNVALDVSEMGVRGHANSLLDLLQGLREETDTASLPIILIGHSLGGLVLKQALVLAKQNDRVYSELLKSTKALAFFATPHRGGNGTTLGQVAVSAVTFFSGNLRNDLVESLRGSSKYLAQLSADFAHQYENYDFLSVVETRGLMRAPFRAVVVDPTSAVIGLAGHREQVLELDRDHRQICKFIQDPDYNRVARHLKRLADAASGERTSNAVYLDIQGSSAAPSSAPNVDPLSGTLKLFSTLDSRYRSALIGQSELLRWLECFENSADAQYLLIEGPSGTGKSAVVSEFASRQEGRLSVFWFCAESTETIQQGLKLASHRISRERQPTALQNGKQSFKDWLAKEHRAKWLVIFDNAHKGLNLQDLLPCKGGKVIITSRHTDIKTDVPFITKVVQPLAAAEATDLFLAKWEQYHGREKIQHTLLPSAASVFGKLHDRPLAIVLAASCVASMRLVVAQEHIQTLDEEESPDEGHLDKKIWTWFHHLLEELTPTESHLLTLLSIFDSTQISEEFLDIIDSGNLGAETAFFSQQYPRSLQRLISLQLVQRCSDPWKQYLCMSVATRECLSHHIAMHQDVNEQLIREGMDLLQSAFNNTDTEDASLMKTFLAAVYPHCRALCLSIEQQHLSLNDGFLHPLNALSTYALGQATSEARSHCYRQYMRTWLLCNNFNLPELTLAEDDGAQHIDPSNVPSWISKDQETNPTSRQQLHRAVFDSISSFLMKDVKDCLVLGAISRSWHGVREEIFRYARELPNAPRDSAVMREVINSIDKGACAGLQSAVTKSVREEGFNTQLLNIGRRSLNYIADIVTACLVDSNGNKLPEVTSDVLESAVSKSMNWFICYSSSMISVAFEDLLHGYIKEAVCSVIEPGMTSGSNVDSDSFASVTGFMVDTFAGSIFQERSRRVARGYWEVIGAMGLFFAADVLLELSVIVQKDANNSTEHHNGTGTLMSKAIELTREGIMGLEGKQTPGWKLSVRRAATWCLQAEQCREGWTTAETDYNYQNQERWEESCILLDINEGAWPLSSLV